MKRMQIQTGVAVLLVHLAFVVDAASWELEDGDVAAFVGEAATVELRRHGYLEAALTSRFSGRNVRFRNFGWQGDTVHAQMRMPNFEGYDVQMRRHEVNVVIGWFGLIEAYEGAKELSGFARAYGLLLDGFPGQMDCYLLLSPTLLEAVGGHVPDPVRRNEDILAYAGTIRALASQRGAGFVDLTAIEEEGGGFGMTDNGVLPSGYGYWRIARQVEAGLGMSPRHWMVGIDIRSGDQADVSGTHVGDLRVGEDWLRFTCHDVILPMPPYFVGGEEGGVLLAEDRVLKVEGLADARWRLEIDGEEIVDASSKEWAEGVRIESGPEYAQAHALRCEIDRKNELFFQYWRPSNWDFAYGERVSVPASRVHDNPEERWFPRELEKYVPLIAASEDKIRALAVPGKREYQLIRIEEEGR